MKTRFQSIRFRLTIYFLLIFICLLALVSAIVLYNYREYSIDKGRNSLRDKSFVVGAWIDFSKSNFNSQADDYIGSQESDLMIQFFDREKKLIGRSSGFNGVYELSESAIEVVTSKDEPYLYESEDGHFIIAINNLYDNDQKKGFVQLLQKKETILNNYYFLFRIILITSVLSVLIAFFAGIFLVDLMLKPINKIMSTVNKIQAEKLEETRLKIINPNDEIGRLSITINDLLNRIQLAISNQRKFLSDAAHELRTPLTILKGNTEVALLKNGSDSPVLNKNLAEIDHLITLTNDLLLIARFDAQSKVMVRERMNISDQVRSVVSNFELKAAAKKMCLHCEVDDEIYISADLSLIKRVIINLVDNAIKYTLNGSKIDVRLCKTNEKQFQLIIKDEGIGIPQDKLSLIFERFYRVAEDRNKSIEGTGLGLAIVKSVLELHDFQINVESEVNKGSTFIVSGPIFQ